MVRWKHTGKEYIDIYEIHTHRHTDTDRHTHTHVYIYIYWPTVFEGDPKAPFSIAATQRCRGRCCPFLWNAPLTIDPYLIMLLSKGASSTIFRSFGMTQHGFEPLSPGPLANNNLKEPGNDTGKVRNKWIDLDRPDHSTIENSYKTEKCPEEPRGD